MKRSEILRKLEARLFWLKNVSDREKAQELLKVIEDSGMLPPTTELSHLKGLRDNAWDPEDQQASQDDTNIS